MRGHRAENDGKHNKETSRENNSLMHDNKDYKNSSDIKYVSL